MKAPTELDRFERENITKFNTNAINGGHGYNMTAGGQGTSGFKWSQDSKNKKMKICPVSREELESDSLVLQIQEIADKYKTNRSIVIGWFRKFGIKNKKLQFVFNNQNLNVWTQEECDRAIGFYLQRYSNKEIARLLNRSETAVCVKLTRLRRERRIPSMRYR